MTVVTDVVIIGAGIVGASAAFSLSKVGKRVIVVEKSSIASGMTKRSGALVSAFFPTEPLARLAHRSIDIYQNWKDAVGGECGYKQSGLAVIDRNSEKLSQTVTSLNQLGINARLLSSAELLEIEPSSRADDIVTAGYDPEAGFIDPVVATQSLAARAKRLGAIFETGTLARKIAMERNRVMAVETNAGEIETTEVVIAAGGWSERLLAPLGVQLGIQNERHQVVFFDRPQELRSGHAAFWDGVSGVYFRPHTYGLTMGGLIAEKAEPGIPDQLDDSVNEDFVSTVRQKVSTRLPAMAGAKFLRGHAGYYDSTADGFPALGRIPGFLGLIVAAGFRNAGLCLAPAVGECVAELIYDGEVRSVDLAVFRPTRF